MKKDKQSNLNLPLKQKLTCMICQKEFESTLFFNFCISCQEKNKADKEAIEKLEAEGHHFNCAARIVWGDGRCQCWKQKK